ncbi:MAG TPA: diacylglycerol kinase family protein [Anaerolineales bacterium]|jgi:YegS/Rv2252/BmrU family lipid kinase|nr:diacylglycerol kinase family protein [Anaerolineales bacterium]
MQVDMQQKPKTYVVLNPVAGVSEPGAVRGKIEAALDTREIPFEIYETTGKKEEDIRQLVRSAVKQEFKLFISAGGDGTLSSVIDGLVGSELPLVIIPTGTWNALARALDIPLQIDQAIELVFHEHTIQTIDAMQVNDGYFVLSVSAGVGALTMKDVERQDKRRLGKFADLRKAVAEVLEFRAYQFEVKIDGKLTRFRAAELMVANTSILGLKSLQLDPSIRMDDGKLNVCRIYANSISDYLRLAISMFRGDQKHNWNVLCVEAQEEVEIRSRERLPVQGDGDLIGQLPITVKIRPKAIQVVTPADATPA